MYKAHFIAWKLKFEDVIRKNAVAINGRREEFVTVHRDDLRDTFWWMFYRLLRITQLFISILMWTNTKKAVREVFYILHVLD